MWGPIIRSNQQNKMVSTTKNSQAQTIAASSWLYGPWLDLTVGCGAWSAPLLLLAYSSVASSTRVWSIAFYGLALLFNYPHYMATIYRAYHRPEDFHKYRIFTVYTTALVFLTIFLSHVWLGILPWIFTLYLTWSPWHYSGQNYGLFMMFARRAGATPGKEERWALYGAFIVSYLVLFMEFHTGTSSDPLFLSLGIPPIVGRYVQAVLCAVFVVLSVFGWSRLAQATGWRKLLPCAVLFSLQFLWFLLPATMSLLRNITTPQSRYSSGVLAVMHSAQYLWVTSYYARREAFESRERSWRPWAYFAVLVAGGIALFIPGPWLASRIFHNDFGASFLIFTALVNLHHFILDGAIWKLRDGRIASLLLNTRDRVSNAASQTTGRLSEAWAWLSGSGQSARAFRVSLAIALLVWGTVDQVRHYFSLRSNLNDLQRAAYLNSFDSQLQMRLARQQLADGHPEEAEAAWKAAMQSSPADLAPRQALLKFLIEHNRFDEAFDLTEASLHYSPKDVNLLVDRGLLALRLGHPDQAVSNWMAALAADRNQIAAHLYLATELDREGKAGDAAMHYQAFLRALARQSAVTRPAPEKVIAIVLRMADCQARASQTENARQSYQLAEKLAAQTKQPKLESVASLNEAALDAANGKASEALQLYQHALRLDDSIGDQTASAQDWLAYGQFLDRSGFSARMVYACYVKSAALDDSNLNASQKKFLTDASKQAAKRVGTPSLAIRQNPEPVLKEALALTR
jgi:tetratricopeptide (TPR) repeat protein